MQERHAAKQKGRDDKAKEKFKVCFFGVRWTAREIAASEQECERQHSYHAPDNYQLRPFQLYSHNYLQVKLIEID